MKWLYGFLVWCLMAPQAWARDGGIPGPIFPVVVQHRQKCESRLNLTELTTCRRTCQDAALKKALEEGRKQYEEIRAQQGMGPGTPETAGVEFTGTPTFHNGHFSDAGEDRYFFCTVKAYIKPSSPVDLPAQAASGSGSDGPLVLRLHGSNTVGAALAPALAYRFLQKKGASDIRRVKGAGPNEMTISGLVDGRLHQVEIHAHGSATGFKDLTAGRCDIAMSSRKIKPDEAEGLRFLGDMTSSACEHVLALDGIAVIVHPANPVESLGISALAQIFSGRITDWAQLGGRPGGIVVYARDENSGTFDTFQHLVLGKTPLTRALRFESNEALSDRVSQDPGGIGFVGLPYIRHARAIAVSDEDAPAVHPTVFTVATEEYPLSRRLFLYTPENPENPHTRPFVSLALSPEGQEFVHGEEAGFVPLAVSVQKRPDLSGFPVQNPSIAAPYRELMEKGRQLSLAFRFKSGGNELDNKALYDIHRVVEYLDRNRSDYESLTLVGFSDDVGDYHHNYRLALERAREVSLKLRSRGITSTRVVSVGEEWPVASNKSPLGREKNRRVEIWLN